MPSPSLTSEQAFDLLVQACPSFLGAERLDRFVAVLEEEDEPDLFVRTAALAHHLVSLVADGRTDEVRATLAVLDEILATGDDDARELAELGLIEPIQNICSHTDVAVTPADVADLLGTEAARSWARHDELWREAARYRPEGPRPADEDYAGIADPDLKRYFQAHRRRMDDGTYLGAADIVSYQETLRLLHRNVLTGGKPQYWPALVVGLVLALCVAIALALWA